MQIDAKSCNLQMGRNISHLFSFSLQARCVKVATFTEKPYSPGGSTKGGQSPTKGREPSATRDRLKLIKAAWIRLQAPSADRLCEWSTASSVGEVALKH